MRNFSPSSRYGSKRCTKRLSRFSHPGLEAIALGMLTFIGILSLVIIVFVNI
jgi:hypothetical protein